MSKLRFTFGLGAEIAKHSAGFARDCAAHGMTPAQAVAAMVAAMSQRDQPGRDALLRDFGALTGHRIDSEAAFGTVTEGFLQRMSDPTKAEREAQRIEAETGGLFKARQVLQMHEAASAASLQQGLADRLRSSDTHADRNAARLLPERPDLHQHATDDRNRLGNVASATLTAGDDWQPYATSGRDTSIRGLLRESFDMDAVEQSQRDPLDDPRVANLSNAV